MNLPGSGITYRKFYGVHKRPALATNRGETYLADHPHSVAYRLGEMFPLIVIVLIVIFVVAHL